MPDTDQTGSAHRWARIAPVLVLIAAIAVLIGAGVAAWRMTAPSPAGSSAGGGRHTNSAQLADYDVGGALPGGDFTLQGAAGPVSLSDFRGRAVLMSFGYTHCPDVCPLTLVDLAQVKLRLGSDGERLQVVFISVDPERDRPEQLAQYVTHFDATFLGLTGTREQLDDVTRRFGAQYRLNPPDAEGRYAVDHTAYIYLLGPDGAVRYLFGLGTDRDLMARGVRTVLEPAG